MSQNLMYEPDCTGSTGYHTCPHCKANFYGGGPALHAQTCPEKAKGYEVCTFHFGPEQVKEAKEEAERMGDETATWYGLSVEMLKEKFPYLL